MKEFIELIIYMNFLNYPFHWFHDQKLLGRDNMWELTSMQAGQEGEEKLNKV